METLDRVRLILRDALSLGSRGDNLSPESALLGAIPEFDSMAVVTVLTMIEDEFGISINDDEIDATVFESLGTLVRFVELKQHD